MISKEKFLAISSVGVQYVGLFALFKLLSTHLESMIFAKYLLFNAAVNLILGLPFTGVQQAITRFGSGGDAVRAHNVMTIAVVQSAIAASLIALILFSISIMPSAQELEVRYQSSFAFAFALTEALKLYVLAYENALMRRKAYLILTVSEYSAKFLLVSVLLAFNLASFFNLVFSLAVSNVIVFFIFTRGSKFNWDSLRLWSLLRSPLSLQILHFAVPVACWSIFGWLRDMSGRYVVDALLTKVDVAGFAVLTTLTTLIPGLINALVGNYYIPIVYAEHNAGKCNVEKNMNRITLRLLLLGAFIVTLAIFASDLFVVIASSEKYRFVAIYLPYTLTAYFVFMVAMVASTELYAKGKANSLLLPNVISGLVGIGSLYFFISSRGFTGGVIGFFVTYVSYAISVLLLLVYYRSGHRAADSMDAK